MYIENMKKIYEKELSLFHSHHHVHVYIYIYMYMYSVYTCTKVLY